MAEAKKNRGQKPLPPAPNDGVVVDVASIETVMAEAEQMEVYQSDIINTFGGGLPWNLKHYEHAIRQELRTGCEAFVRAGAHLIVAKACAEHGEWSSLLERIGLSRSHAHRMMEAAKRIEGISNVATSQHFMKSVGSQSKLIELLSLPEEQFTELAETGETDGLTVDDVDRMAIRELRSSVRDLRADLQAKDERISKLSDQVNQQHDELAKTRRRLAKLTPNETADQMALEFGGHKIAARNHYRQIESDVYAYIDYCHDHGIDYADVVTHHINDLLNPLLGMLFDLQLRGVNEPAKHAAELVLAAHGGGTGAA